MKNIFIVLGILCYCSNISFAADSDPVQMQLHKIYNECESGLSSEQAVDVIQGNIDDVKKEDKLRRCLKYKTLDVASSYLPDTELENFRNALDSMEEAASNIYKILIFCQDKEQTEWCQQRINDDMSLGKLLFEKELTSQTVRILTDTLNSKQGGYQF